MVYHVEEGLDEQNEFVLRQENVDDDGDFIPSGPKSPDELLTDDDLLTGALIDGGKK